MDESGPGPTTAPRSIWLAYVGFFVALLLAVGVAGWLLSQKEPPLAAVPGIGEFRLPLLETAEDGVATLGPPDLRGGPVLIDFWATWCGPCHVQTKILAGIYDEYRAQGVEFLALNVGEERSLVEEFVVERPFPYPVVLDETAEVSGAANVFALPTVLVLDAEGNVQFVASGITGAGRLRSVLDPLL